MTDTTAVTKSDQPAVTRAREDAVTLTPPVDIFEDDTGITLIADLPGTSKDHLDIQVDGDSLSIAGDIDIPLAENMDALYADVRARRYQRRFALSKELDRENIDASLTNGVLTLRIPKRAEHRPRRIEVKIS